MKRALFILFCACGAPETDVSTLKTRSMQSAATVMLTDPSFEQPVAINRDFVVYFDGKVDENAYVTYELRDRLTGELREVGGQIYENEVWVFPRWRMEHDHSYELVLTPDPALGWPALTYQFSTRPNRLRYEQGDLDSEQTYTIYTGPGSAPDQPNNYWVLIGTHSELDLTSVRYFSAVTSDTEARYWDAGADRTPNTADDSAYVDFKWTRSEGQVVFSRDNLLTGVVDHSVDRYGGGAHTYYTTRDVGADDLPGTDDDLTYFCQRDISDGSTGEAWRWTSTTALPAAEACASATLIERSLRERVGSVEFMTYRKADDEIAYYVRRSYTGLTYRDETVNDPGPDQVFFTGDDPVEYYVEVDENEEGDRLEARSYGSFSQFQVYERRVYDAAN